MSVIKLAASLLPRWGGHRKTGPRRSPARRKLVSENLESRNLLAVFTVTSDADAGSGSLRQAILDANDAAGADTIEFAPGLAGGEVMLQTIGDQTLGDSAFAITSDISIVGDPAKGLTLNASQLMRHFYIHTGAKLSLENLTISNGKHQGVDGSGIGGGAAGMGGAIFNEGTLILNKSLMTFNTALGGDGGTDHLASGGRGGGRDQNLNSLFDGIDGILPSENGFPALGFGGSGGNGAAGSSDSPPGGVGGIGGEEGNGGVGGNGGDAGIGGAGGNGGFGGDGGAGGGGGFSINAGGSGGPGGGGGSGGDGTFALGGGAGGAGGLGATGSAFDPQQGAQNGGSGGSGGDGGNGGAGGFGAGGGGGGAGGNGGWAGDQHGACEDPGTGGDGGDGGDGGMGGFGGGGGGGGIGGTGGSDHCASPPLRGADGDYGESGSGGFGGGDGNAGFGAHYGGGGAAMGGAIFNHAGVVEIVNSTIAKNSLERGKGGDCFGQNEICNGFNLGGALFNHQGTISILNATFWDNSTDGPLSINQGGISIYQHSGNLRLTNTLVESTSIAAAVEIHGGAVAGSHNVLPIAGGVPPTIVVTEPNFIPLGALSDNGGPTLTYAPIHTFTPDWIIDQGTNAGDPSLGGLPATDQTGRPRIDDGLLDGNPIVDVGAVEFVPIDFGDAPDSYQTLLGSEGARHLLQETPLLGVSVSSEADGMPTNGAVGDSLDDGIFFLDIPPLIPGQTATVELNSDPGVLDYFVDFDRDGTFGNNANEVFSTTLAGGGGQQLSIPVPITAQEGKTYARLRISSAGGLGPTGLAPDGEVEDYEFTIIPPDPDDQISEATTVSVGDTVTGDIGNEGDVDMFSFIVTENQRLTFDIDTFGSSLDSGIRLFDASGSALAFSDDDTGPVPEDDGSESFIDFTFAAAGTYYLGVSTFNNFSYDPLTGLGDAGGSTTGTYDLIILEGVPPEPGEDFENFDSVTVPGLPDGWSSLSTNANTWTTVGNSSHSPANHAFAENLAAESDSSLFAPSVTIATDDAQLSFYNRYDLEDSYDGGVLEVSVDGAEYIDVLQAGASFLNGGYNGTIDDFNPALGGRSGWTGISNGWINTVVQLPANFAGRQVQFRWRLGTDSIVGADGWSIDTLELTGVGPPSTEEFDYGDAPDSNYATLLASNGPRHTLLAGGPTLGPSVDPETDGQPDSTATGDDTDGNDDDDGIVAVTSLFTGQSASMEVNAPVGGELDAWLDVNGNGMFDHPAEHINAGTSLTLSPGNNTVPFSLPADAVPGLSFARLRISTTGGLPPTGPASDGEVEDYEVLVERVFVVNSAGDLADNDLGDGICDTGGMVGAEPECTLRAAIQQANATTNAGLVADKIHFNITGVGPHVLTAASALPAVSDAVIIDATTQPGFSGTPLFEIDGTIAGAATDGLTISAGNSTVRGLAINRFAGSGLLLAGSGGNTIQQNVIGTSPNGTADLGNGGHGVVIFNSPDHLVGGPTTGEGNVISGNGLHGVYITRADSTGNQVQSNIIGLGRNGITPIRNDGMGVRIDRGASENQIGGSGNVISGNRTAGVAIVGETTTDNTVAGNLIGTDITGTLDRGNLVSGVTIDDAPANKIGVPGDGNVISGNNADGIFITGVSAVNNLIHDNFLGTDISGSNALPNGQAGVTINEAPNNTIGGTAAETGNVISGNSEHGIFVVGTNAAGNKIEGNLIGTNVAGDAAVPNVQFGVVLRDAPNNTVGGAAAGARNVVSGNLEHGVAILNEAATNNSVTGNLIGTDINGTAAVGNAKAGVLIWKAPGNRVGGPSAAERNIISGNDLFGVRISTALASGNMVVGNYIGTDIAGATALPNSDSGVQLANAQNTMLGGSAVGAGNLISGNGNHGIALTGAGVLNNAIQGNFIGVDVTGSVAMGNAGAGVRIGGGARDNTVGGDASAGEGNVISANGAEGVFLVDIGTRNTTVRGNLIGTSATGTVDLGNGGSGVSISESHDNMIGGTASGAGNIISGNGLFGVVISGAQATGNVLRRNTIGADVTGTAELGNASTGVLISAPSNMVGGTTADAGNLISGNGFLGLRLNGALAIGNTIQGNLVGTQIDGVSPLGNTAQGIRIDNASGNSIGGTVANAGNVIAHSSSHGVVVVGTATGNSIQGNSIFGNGGLGIGLNLDGDTLNDTATGSEDADEGPNRLQNKPVVSLAVLNGNNLEVTYVVPSAVDHAAYPLRVEFFLADSAGQEGQIFLDAHTYEAAQALSSAMLTIDATGLEASASSQIVATATASDGNTSEFSASVTVSLPLQASPAAAVAFDSSHREDLSADQLNLQPIIDTSILLWEQRGLTQQQRSRLDHLEIRFAELDGSYLGLTTANSVLLDHDAAGHGWFADTTPDEDSEFQNSESPAANRMDLLTVIMHEMGHVIGFSDLLDDSLAEDVMYAWLGVGERRNS